MITLVHLYPRELGINGDVGNVLALAKRAEWRGMPLEVVNHDVGSVLPKTAHLVHVGSGPISGQELVRADLDRIASTLRTWAASGVPFLAISGGWQLLGTSLTDLDGIPHNGVGVFPTTARLSEMRTVREVWTADAAGFENFGAQMFGPKEAGPQLEPDGPVLGDLVLDTGSSVATNLHGPFLPMNPAWADLLLERAAARAGIPMGRADDRLARADEFAANSRLAIRKRLGL